MAAITTLMHTGMPAAQARQLGSSDPSFQLAAAGTTQATAAPIPGSYGFLFPVALTTPAPGVVLPPSSGAAQTVLFNSDANPCNIYPSPGEILNSWTANTPLKLAAGASVIATPGAHQSWIMVVQAAAATQGP
jgi:hypothetical protein